MTAHSSPAFADADTVARCLPWPILVEALREAFRSPFEAPDRHIHDLAVPGRPDATALLMPAWVPGELYGVKLVNVFPGNAEEGLPAVNGVYVLFSGRTGLPLAFMDGSVLTARRTVATSALASSYLSRPDSSTLAIFGTGRLASLLVEAHASVRPIRRALIWGRDRGKAAELARAIAAGTGLSVEAADDPQEACSRADIVSCATLAATPIVWGDWLRPGTHVDLIGAFKPTMRETDAAAVKRAQVFIDTIGGSRAEAGDLLQAEAEGAFRWTDVRADLAALCGGTHGGRRTADEITLFKSVGCAVEDLAAARIVHAAMGGGA